MILVEDSHYVNHWFNPSVTEDDLPVPKAFTHLVNDQFGSSTRIDYIFPFEISCQTSTHKGVHVVRYFGPEKDMELLVRAARLYLSIRTMRHREISDRELRLLPARPEGQLISQRIVKFPGLLVERNLVRAIILNTLGAEPTDEAYRLKFDDFLAAAELSIESGVPFAEVLTSV